MTTGTRDESAGGIRYYKIGERSTRSPASWDFRKKIIEAPGEPCDSAIMITNYNFSLFSFILYINFLIAELDSL